MIFTCNALIPFFTSTQVQWWREPQDRYRHSGRIPWRGLVWTTHRWAGAQMATRSWRWRRNSTQCRAGYLNVSKGLSGLRFRRIGRLGCDHGPGPALQSTSELPRWAASQGEKQQGCWQRAAWSPAAEGRQTEEQSATRSTPGTRHQKRSKLYPEAPKR